MTDLTVIILTKNEALHIARCLKMLAPLNAREVLVVDCFSSDGTQRIAEMLGAKVIEHDWPGNQAAQFNWALDNLQIKSSWVLRVDADEYLYPETIEEVKHFLPGTNGLGQSIGKIPANVTSLSLSRARRFLRQNIKFGGRDVELVRFFRYGYGRSEQSEMDEHIVTSKGQNIKLIGKFVDDSLISFESWQKKHRDYARREASMVVNGKVNKNKIIYYKLPPFFRAFAYFCVRYFLKLGFLDGKAGWQWNFWQGLWYRCLVDKEIGVLKHKRRALHLANSK